MARSLVCLLLASTLTLAACGGGKKGTEPVLPRGLELRQAPPPPSATAGTLARIADGPAAQRRLGYVNRTALRAADVPAARVVRAVLGPGAGPDDAVRAGDRVVAPTDGPVAVTAITPDAMSAAQTCLGDTLAQTILGPQTMGRDAAVGVGLTPDGLRICGAPHYVRDVVAMRAALARQFPRADVAREEQGERVIVRGVIATDTLRPALVRLLAAGPALRGLAWR